MNMSQKGFSNIALVILVVVIIAGAVGYFALRKSPAQPILPVIEQPPITQITPPTTDQTPPATFTGNTFSTNLNGYFETCIDTSAMYKRTNGSWEKVSNELPGKGGYYLDNNFFGYGMCDVVVCTELPKPYTMQLVEYKKVGEKAPPSGSGYTANTLPVYQTVSLSGDVKIDIQYFSDKNCQNKKTFSTVIKK
jgi:hypothetical protein